MIGDDVARHAGVAAWALLIGKNPVTAGAADSGRDRIGAEVAEGEGDGIGAAASDAVGNRAAKGVAAIAAETAVARKAPPVRDRCRRRRK